MRQAARLPQTDMALRSGFLNGTAVIRGCVAALFVGGLNLFFYTYNIYNAPVGAFGELNGVWASIVGTAEEVAKFGNLYLPDQISLITNAVRNIDADLKPSTDTGIANQQLTKCQRKIK
jgi:hypothetical protein